MYVCVHTHTHTYTLDTLRVRVDISPKPSLAVGSGKVELSDTPGLCREGATSRLTHLCLWEFCCESPHSQRPSAVFVHLLFELLAKFFPR